MWEDCIETWAAQTMFRASESHAEYVKKMLAHNLVLQSIKVQMVPLGSQIIAGALALT